MNESTRGHGNPLARAGPAARRDPEDVTIQELYDELVIYDLKRNKAHSLNDTAARIWRWCDGETPPAMMAQRLAAQIGVSADQAEPLVWLALDRLEKAHLLQARVQRPLAYAGLTRRQVLARIGIVAALPVIYTLVAPGMAQAASLAFCQQRCSGQSGAGACHSTTTCSSINTIIGFRACVNCCTEGGLGWDNSLAAGCTVVFI